MLNYHRERFRKLTKIINYIIVSGLFCQIRFATGIVMKTHQLWHKLMKEGFLL